MSENQLLYPTSELVSVKRSVGITPNWLKISEWINITINSLPPFIPFPFNTFDTFLKLNNIMNIQWTINNLVPFLKISETKYILPDNSNTSTQHSNVCSISRKCIQFYVQSATKTEPTVCYKQNQWPGK